MKFNSYIFDLYKSSSHGKDVINSFTTEVGEDCYDLTVKYNPLNKSFPKDSFNDMADSTFCYYTSELEKPVTIDEARANFQALINGGLRVDGDQYIYPKDYKLLTAAIAPISFAFYVSSEFYFPYLFQYNFFSLKKTADLFELSLPIIPKKSDYKARCMYYMDLCELFYSFRIENNLSPVELCAFLYDFAPNMIAKAPNIIPKPTQAWFIGGLIDQIDKAQGCPFWQANAETKKGDILIHYETSPISAITQMWIAQTDGIIDPFFHYYSNAYIGDNIQIPHISLKELKADAYFSVHPLVRKSFQGVNGWSVSSEDYTNLLKIITEKSGKQPEYLPKLYTPNISLQVKVQNERDVESLLLEPLMQELGIKPTDYIRQLSLQAGRGARIYPDYALFYKNKQGSESAKILIEAKLFMKSNRDVEDAFCQAVSYAKLLESSIVILCDKIALYIYEKNEGYDRDRYTKHYWGDVQNPDVFRYLQTIINSK